MFTELFSQKYISYRLPALGYENINKYLENKENWDENQLKAEEIRSFIEKELEEVLVIGGTLGLPWKKPIPSFTTQEIQEFRRSSFDLRKTMRYDRFMRCITNSNNESKLNNNYEPFIWYKNMNIPIPNDFKIKKRQYDFPNRAQKKLSAQLKNIPVFVLKNGFGDVLSYNSTDEYRNNWHTKAIQEYIKSFFWLEDDREMTLVPIFFNPNDAEELKEEIYRKYPYSAKEVDVDVVAISLDKAYELNRKSKPGLQFRFIPDFQELGQLIESIDKLPEANEKMANFQVFDYYGPSDVSLKSNNTNQHKNYKYSHKSNKNIQFYSKQLCGEGFFQGQPIYRIMPVGRKYNNTQYYVNYTKEGNPLTNSTIYYFTTLETAQHEWDKFRNIHSKLKLPKKPKILAYNLESLLLDYELNQSPNFVAENFIIVSNYETYKAIKSNLGMQKQRGTIEALYNKLKPQLLVAKVWSKRMWLSLLSKQFPNE
uniref:hypothetical protein n=1 Tax=Porphyridium aerugineum TaxID=2792 RepID=UPI001FCD8069|nr:hypothetical protein MW505_pgp141 [Porphyridium aerugineum]UNJ17856.1 hypothetical protein [Porphyridium aerugineum]